MSAKNTVLATLSLLLFFGNSLFEEMFSPEMQRYIEQNTAEMGENFQKSGNTIILMYHTFLAEGEPTAEQDGLYTTADKLAADIDVLRGAGYHSISIWAYRMGLFDPNEKYFILTLDDGYESNYTIAFPVLKEKGVYADIFANTGMMNQRNHLTWDMCREMEATGLVHVYSHLSTHDKATSLSREDQQYWLGASVSSLGRELGGKRLWGMSYPYGDYDRAVFEMYRDMGARFQLVQGVQFDDPELLVRINVPYSADMNEIIEKAVHN